MFVTIFSVTFALLFYFDKYRVTKHCHIISPLEEEFNRYPEFKKFFYKYENKFDIAYRREGGPPMMVFLDHKFRELERHELVKLQVK
jgi:hypothetical protein